MQLIILSHADVERLLPFDACVDVMAEALAALARGQIHQPLRTVVRPPGAAGLMGLMPSYAAEPPLYGLKAVCVFPGNTAIGKDAHQGGVMLFDGATGEPLALLNASAITAIRTGAVSAAATRALARPSAGELAVLGAGVQARAHLLAMAHARPIRRARLVSATPARAQALAAELAPVLSFPVEVAESAEAAVRGADIVVTATTAAEPVLRREWLSPGAHINAVGSSIPTTREIDTATMRDAALFVDRRESTLNESGDYLFAAREGAIGPDHIRAEIGAVLAGQHPGRTSPDEITLFKSLGLAAEDMAAAAYVYRRALADGAGARVDF
jgi:ornithine cyclodeaminase